MTDVLVINRDADTDRLARFAASAAALDIPFRRVASLDAHDPAFSFKAHAALIGRHFWGKPEAKPGAIGCFLSHRRAWEDFLASDAPHALICEDDAVLTEGPCRAVEAARKTGADIVFANDRLASWGAADGIVGTRPLPEIMADLATRGGPAAAGLKRAPGGDAYLLSRDGAARLLALTAAQRIVCGVDWAMLWNALPEVSETMRAAFPELAILCRTLPLTAPPLAAHVLARPVAAQAGGPSVLRHAITKTIAELLAPSGTTGADGS